MLRFPPVTLTKANALEKLRRQRDAADRTPPDTSSPEYKKWKRDTEVAISNVFGEHTRHTKEFDAIRYGLIAFTDGTPSSARTEACRDGLKDAKVMLQSMIDEIKEYWNESENTSNEDDALRSAFEARSGVPDPSGDVFVVHGHDEEMKQFACRKGLRPRARQNVILELGFFLGRLGRGRVMALSREINGFDLPSDYSGVIFTPFDVTGHWRFELVRELSAAGFVVDANKLM